MIDKIKHTFKHSFVYSLGNLSVKIIGLVLLPIYTDKLSTAQYGILSLLETTALFMAIIFSVNISNAMMRWWADVKDNNKKKTYVFTTFIFLLFSTIILNITLQPFSSKFAIWLFEEESFTIYFNILFLSVSFDILNKFIISLIRILEKSFLFIIVSSIKLAAILFLTIYFIVGLEMGVKGIILAQLIGHILGFIFLFPILLKHIIPKIDFPILKSMLAYSIPLTFTALSATILNMGDRYVLKFLLGDAEVGIYSLAYKIAGFLNFFVLQSFQMAFLPIAFKMYKEKNFTRFFSKTTTYLAMGLTFGALGLALLAPEFVRVFAPTNDKFWEAAQYVGPIGLLIIIFGIKYMISISFHLAKKTSQIPLIVISFALLNVLFNFLMIPHWGINGAIISSIISNIIMGIIYYFITKKLFQIKYEISKIFFIIVIGIGLYYLSFLFNNINFWINLSLKILIIIIFPLIILFGGFLEPIEKERVIQIWTKWNNPKKWRNNLRKTKGKK